MNDSTCTSLRANTKSWQKTYKADVRKQLGEYPDAGRSDDDGDDVEDEAENGDEDEEADEEHGEGEDEGAVGGGSAMNHMAWRCKHTSWWRSLGCSAVLSLMARGRNRRSTRCSRGR